MQEEVTYIYKFNTKQNYDKWCNEMSNLESTEAQ